MHYFSLQVILNEHAEQNAPIIRYELPYSFDVVAKLPRPRNQAAEGNGADGVDLVNPRPPKVRRTVRGHAGHVGDAASQSVGLSGLGQLSSGDSRGPTNGTVSRTSEPPAPPGNTHCVPSTTETPTPSRQPTTLVSDEEATDVRDPVLEGINPSRGPIAGGKEIWIEGSNFPTGSTPLYVRFGDNFSRVVGALLVSFEHRLINSRLFDDPTCCRAHRRWQMFRERSQSCCPVAPIQMLLF